MRETYPVIPEVVNGAVLGATTLNSYTRAARWLLGVSHAPYIGERIQGGNRMGDWGTLWIGWAHHNGDTMHYRLWCQNDSAGKTWRVRIQVQGDNAAWQTPVELSGTETGFQLGSVDLTALSHLTRGKLYPWRIQASTDDETYNTVCEPWRMWIADTITGWQAPPSFANATIADAADLNIIRSNLSALHAVTPSSEPLLASHFMSHGAHGQWATVGIAHYRYRPEGIRVGLEACGGSPSVGFRWRVNARGTGSEYATVYESPNIVQPAWNWAWFEQTVNLEGIGAALGDIVRVNVQITHDTAGHQSFGRRSYVVRHSSQNPSGAWPTLPDWAHGDANVGAARLNALSTALGELYTGGSEELWGETGMAHMDVVYPGEHMGVYKRRWLVYMPIAETAPEIIYGPNMADTYSLPTDGTAAWVNFDLSYIEDLAPGQKYVVRNAWVAFESDTVLEAAV